LELRFLNETAMDDPVLKYIMYHCKGLLNLFIDGCPGITDSSFIETTKESEAQEEKEEKKKKNRKMMRIKKRSIICRRRRISEIKCFGIRKR